MCIVVVTSHSLDITHKILAKKVGDNCKIMFLFPYTPLIFFLVLSLQLYEACTDIGMCTDADGNLNLISYVCVKHRRCGLIQEIMLVAWETQGHIHSHRGGDGG